MWGAAPRGRAGAGRPARAVRLVVRDASAGAAGPRPRAARAPAHAPDPRSRWARSCSVPRAPRPPARLAPSHTARPPPRSRARLPRRSPAARAPAPQDTEFPGVVVRPVGTFSSTSDFHYQTLRANVDLLRVIQLGLAFCDDAGELADSVPVWQFNFRFSLEDDLYAPDSVELLTRAGLDFRAHAERGIEADAFAEALTSSGLVLSDDVRWVSFHSGYDFGYLLRLLSGAALPETDAAFAALLRVWFPALYDVKCLALVSDDLRGGLARIAEELDVERGLPLHTAGADALLTAAVFFRLRARFFGGVVPDAQFRGVLFGLGAGAPPTYLRDGAAGAP